MIKKRLSVLVLFFLTGCATTHTGQVGTMVVDDVKEGNLIAATLMTLSMPAMLIMDIFTLGNTLGADDLESVGAGLEAISKEKDSGLSNSSENASFLETVAAGLEAINNESDSESLTTGEIANDCMSEESPYVPIAHGDLMYSSCKIEYAKNCEAQKKYRQLEIEKTRKEKRHVNTAQTAEKYMAWMRVTKWNWLIQADRAGIDREVEAQKSNIERATKDYQHAVQNNFIPIEQLYRLAGLRSNIYANCLTKVVRDKNLYQQ